MAGEKFQEFISKQYKYNDFLLFEYSDLDSALVECLTTLVIDKNKTVVISYLTKQANYVKNISSQFGVWLKSKNASESIKAVYGDTARSILESISINDYLMMQYQDILFTREYKEKLMYMATFVSYWETTQGSKNNKIKSLDPMHALEVDD